MTPLKQFFKHKSQVICPEMQHRAPEAENFRTRSTLVQQEFDQIAGFLESVGARGYFVFFGSARARSTRQIEEARSELNDKLALTSDENEKARLQAQLTGLQRKQWLAPVWDATAELSKLLTQWSISAEGRSVGNAVWSLLPGGNEEQPLMVCTGGGPGFMEAGNMGAHAVPNARSIGVGVKLPFETTLNEFVPAECGITVNSFYARKYWEVYAIKAMVVCPGGFGTLDEMFEVLTLMQCHHLGSGARIPVVLLGKEFWENAVNFRFLAEKEVISRQDYESLCLTDSPEEAFQFIVSALKMEAEKMASAPSSPKPKRRDGGTASNADSNVTSPQAPFRRDRDDTTNLAGDAAAAAAKK